MLGRIRTDFIESAKLEIYKYVPPALLPENIDELCFDEFVELFARARYLEEVEENIFANAIAKVFSDE